MEVLTGLLYQALSLVGYDAEPVIRPEAALVRVRADPERFALVTTDQTMPSMTGYSSFLTPERPSAAGIESLLQKPANIMALGESVRRTLPASL